MKKLNPRQRTFCLEYLATGNATQSAIKAGYSPKYARNNAPKLLQNTTILSELKQLQKTTITEAVMSITERKERLSEIAREGNIKQTNPVEAIRELNRMGGDYPPQKHLVGHKIEIEVIHSDRKALGVPERKELPEGR